MSGGGLFEELKRRRVARVALAYAVVAWGAIEVVDVVLPRLGLPDWTVTLVVVLALGGFPVAVALAWAFDLTAEGVRRTDGPGRGLRGAAGWLGAGAVAAVLAVTAWGLAGGPPSSRGWGIVFAGAEAGAGTDAAGEGGAGADGAGVAAGARDARESVSIAVLPFADLSAEGDQVYFADGLAEELLNALAQIPRLRVAARTSSFQFRGEERDVRQIARELSVGTVLEGSVRKSGDRLRVTAQLIDATSGYHLWSETYDRRLEDVFEVQDDVAHAIVDALEVELLGADTGRIVRSGTESVHAHDLYLLGRFHWHQRGAALDSALVYFRQALEVDPEYAPAWAGLANTWAVIGFYLDVPTEEALEQAQDAARRALAIDPTLAEAHAALGQVAQNYEWDWGAAERHYRRALESNPMYATAHQWRAELLLRRGRMDGARRAAERAVDLDPLSPLSRWILASVHTLEGRVDAMVAEYDRALRLAPGFDVLHYYAALGLLQHGRTREAGERLDRFATTDEEREAFRRVVAAVADPSRRDEGLRAADRVRGGIDGPPRLADYETAPLYYMMGAHDRALDILEAAFERRAVNAPLMLVAGAGEEDFRSHPRYRALARSIGLDWLLEDGTR